MKKKGKGGEGGIYLETQVEQDETDSEDDFPEPLYANDVYENQEFLLIPQSRCNIHH